LLYFKTKKVKTTRYTIHQGGEGMNKSKRIGSAQKQIKWIIFGSGVGIQKPFWTKKPVPTSFIKKKMKIRKISYFLVQNSKFGKEKLFAGRFSKKPVNFLD
jgi:hypothetical protein